MKNLIMQKRSYDNRDLDLMKDIAPLLVLAKGKSGMIDLSKIKKLYQNGFPTCGAHAGAYKKEVQELSDSGYIGGFSPRYFWIKIKQIDGWPLLAGTDMRSILKVLSKWGICKYDMLPNVYEMMTLSQYSDPKVITKEMDDDAQENIISSAYGFLKKGFTRKDLENALDVFGSLTFIMDVDDGFFGTAYPTFTTKKYGHAMEAFFCNENYIFVLDSTEKNLEYSVKYISWNYFKFIREVGTAVDVPNATIREMIRQKNILTRIVELYNTILKLLKK
jgi:hypothetical protein